jgi:hypothetical protein
LLDTPERLAGLRLKCTFGRLKKPPLRPYKTPFAKIVPQQLIESTRSAQLFVLDFRLDIEKDLKPGFVRYRKRIEEACRQRGIK